MWELSASYHPTCLQISELLKSGIKTIIIPLRFFHSRFYIYKSIFPPIANCSSGYAELPQIHAKANPRMRMELIIDLS